MFKYLSLFDRYNDSFEIETKAHFFEERTELRHSTYSAFF